MYNRLSLFYSRIPIRSCDERKKDKKFEMKSFIFSNKIIIK